MNKTLLLSSLLALSLCSGLAEAADNLLGAEQILQKLAAERASKVDRAAESMAEAAFRAKLLGFAKRAATIPPKEAAQEWLALFDEWRKLPAPERAEVRSDEAIRPATPVLLLTVIPPPAAW